MEDNNSDNQGSSRKQGSSLISTGELLRILNTVEIPNNINIRNSNMEYLYISPNIIGIWVNYPTKPLLSQELFRRISSDRPYLIFNLTEASLTHMEHSVINCPWVCPSEYTKAPSVPSILSICYSLQSWLSLDPDNIVILICHNGIPNSGILIACFLKIIGAFTFCNNAYNYYCNVRVIGRSTGI